MTLMNYKKDKDKDTYFFSGDKKKSKKTFKSKSLSSPFEKLASLNIK